MDQRLEIENLIKSANKIIQSEHIKVIELCLYYGREYGDSFEIETKSLAPRIEAAINEGFYTELASIENRLIVCQREYPGPQPTPEFFINKTDIPSGIRDLDGE